MVTEDKDPESEKKASHHVQCLFPASPDSVEEAFSSTQIISHSTGNKIILWTQGIYIIVLVPSPTRKILKPTFTTKCFC